MADDKICTRCGKLFRAYMYATMCFKCLKEKNLEDIQNSIVSGESDRTDCEDDVICPWCGEILEPDCESSEFYDEGTHVMQCWNCNKEFALSTSVSYSYSTERGLPVYVLRERELTRQAREKARIEGGTQ